MSEILHEPKRRRIYLMRHGSVTYFDPAKGPIDSDSVALNETGRTQASAAGIAFAHVGAHFDRVIVSNLPRTLETARRVLNETCQHIEPEIWPELRELQSGSLDAVPNDQLRDAVVGAFEGVVPEYKRFAGGESIGELLDRVHAAVARLRSDPNWNTVLMVLHGGVNRAIISLALTGARQFLGNLQQAPACISALDVGAGKDDWVVRFVGMAPTDLLQPEARLSTLEGMLAEYVKTRAADKSGV